jgi:hypothetical protein
MGEIGPLVTESPGMMQPDTRRVLKITFELPTEKL